MCDYGPYDPGWREQLLGDMSESSGVPREV